VSSSADARERLSPTTNTDYNRLSSLAQGHKDSGSMIRIGSVSQLFENVGEGIGHTVTDIGRRTECVAGEFAASERKPEEMVPPPVSERALSTAYSAKSILRSPQVVRSDALAPPPGYDTYPGHVNAHVASPVQVGQPGKYVGQPAQPSWQVSVPSHVAPSRRFAVSTKADSDADFTKGGKGVSATPLARILVPSRS
jgi:hypothetical protein